jgi:hypothetical protein
MARIGVRDESLFSAVDVQLDASHQRKLGFFFARDSADQQDAVGANRNAGSFCFATHWIDDRYYEPWVKFTIRTVVTAFLHRHSVTLSLGADFEAGSSDLCRPMRSALADPHGQLDVFGEWHRHVTICRGAYPRQVVGAVIGVVGDDEGARSEATLYQT